MNIVSDGSGRITLDLGFRDEANDSALQPDGKIVIVGNVNSQLAVVRLTAAGLPDTTFGEQGALITTRSGDWTSMALQPDGKILVAGRIYNGNGYDLGLLRLNSNGAIDETFVGPGMMRVAPQALALQPDGKILIATSGSGAGSSDSDFVAYRFSPNGSLDSTFGAAGRVQVDMGGYDELSSIAIANGKIILVGTTSNGNAYDISVTRLDGLGSLDKTFSGDGKLTINLAEQDYARDVAVQTDGRIVVVGHSDGRFATVRIAANGVLDPTFHATGVATIGLTLHDMATSVALQSDGKIVVLGDAWSWGDLGVVRYNTDGSLDQTFARDGFTTLAFTDYRDEARSVLVRPDGQIILTGNAYNTGFAVAALGSDGRLARFGPDSAAPVSVSVNPGPHATGVPTGSTITFDFSESVALGSGRILLKTLSGATADIFQINDQSNYTIDGSHLILKPKDGLAPLTSYTLVFENASVTDLAGNSFVSGSGYDFTTGPTVQTLGTGGDDFILSGRGSESIDGHTGRDAVVFFGDLDQYRIVKSGIRYEVQAERSAGAIHSLVNVEDLKFFDFTVNLTIQASVARLPVAESTRLIELYLAFFNRVPDSNGLEFWIEAHASGRTISSIADDFYATGIHYSSLTGYSAEMTDSDFVRVIYKNVLGRTGATAPPDEDVAFWANELSSGHRTKGNLVEAVLNSAHTFKNDPAFGWVADLLDNKNQVAHTFAVDWGLSYVAPEDSVRNGMQIAAAVSPYDTSVALQLVGIDSSELLLY